jgi:adenine nucleotide transporter 17
MGRPKLDPEIAALADALAGAAAGVFSLALLYPLDTYKSRKQLMDKQRKPSKTEDQLALAKQEIEEIKKGVEPEPAVQFSEEQLSFVKSIGTKEFFGWYDGIGIGLLSEGAQQASYYYFYTLLKKRFQAHYNKNPDTASSLIIGSIAGALNMIITSPLSTVHTRMQTHAVQHPNEQATIGSTVQEIVKKDGVTGLWRGLKTSLVLVVNPSITFFAFETLRKNLEKFLSGKEGGKISAGWLFILGAIAKLIATIVTYPLILAKTRLQADKLKQYRSFFHVWLKVVEKSGFVGLYGGMSSKLLQTCISSAIKFTMKDAFDDFAFKILLFALNIKVEQK